MTFAILAPAPPRLPLPTAATGFLRRERSWIVPGGCSLGTVLACAALAPAHLLPGGPVMAAVLATVFLAALAASLAGGVAFSALCGVVLFRLDLDPVRAVQIMMLCSLANQATITWRTRRNVRWRELLPFLAGGALGILPGLWLLLHADHQVFTRTLGAALLAYSGTALARSVASARPAAARLTGWWQHPALDLLAGALGGITGAAGAFPSAPVTIWCSLKGWDKARQMAVFQPFILVMQLASLLAVSFAMRHGGGGFAPGLAPGDLACIPVGLLGTALGLALCRRTSTRQFALALNLMLSAAAISFLV